MHGVPHVLCRLPRDRHQRRGRVADTATFIGDRRALHLSKVHGLFDVLSGRRVDRRSRERPIDGSPAAGGLDGKPKVAALTMNEVLKQRRISRSALEMTVQMAIACRHLEQGDVSAAFERLNLEL